MTTLGTYSFIYTLLLLNVDRLYRVPFTTSVSRFFRFCLKIKNLLFTRNYSLLAEKQVDPTVLEL